MNFSKIKLSDIAEVIMGQSPPSAFYNDKGEGMPFFQGKTEFGSLYPRIEKHTTKVTKEAKAGDILFTVRAPVGEVNIANVDCCIGRGLAALRPKEENKYLYYKIQNDKVRFVSKSSGAIYDSINKDILSDTELKIQYSKSVRDKIGSFLWGYDYLIQNNLRRIELLEESARLLYREWFVHLRFPGHEHTKIVNGAPEGWERKKLGEVIVLNYGKALKADDRKEGPFPVYGSSGIVGYHDKQLVKSPGIIVGRKGNVGSVHLSFKDFYPIDTVYFVEPQYTNFFIYYNLKHQNFISSHAAVPGLNRNFAYSLPVILPNKLLSKQFEEYLSPVYKQIRNLQEMNEKLKKARDILLPRLMNGDIAV